MSPLRRALADYLILRRALGFKLERAEKLLAQFVSHLEAGGAEVVTTELALGWARLPAAGHPSWWAKRLTVVRGFAAYLHTLDPATEIPPRDLLPARGRRASPYLYTVAEIVALIEAARILRFPQRVLTYQTLIGLLAVSGLRVGEAIALDRDDLDLCRGELVVRNAKFGKSRLVLLHPTTIAALERYLRRRERLRPAPRTPALFTSSAGTRLSYCNVHWTFQRLVRQVGLLPRSASCRPRIHDLRHSFAVRSLLDAYTAGEDAGLRLTVLSTYLGHVDPGSTYWYLEAAPELLALAGGRLERHLAGRS